MPIAKLRNVTLNFQLDGSVDAPALVLSNAIGTDMSFWRAQVGPFTKHFRVLRYDTRGHGASSSPPGDHTIADLGNDLLELMDYLEIKSGHVCGVSLGGLTALWLAIESPHRFSSLIAANTAARVGTSEGWNARIEQVQQQGISSIAEASLARCFSPDFLAQHPEQKTIMWDMLQRCSASGYSACCTALRDADLSHELSRIPLPALVLSGAHDQATPPSDGQFLQQCIANASYEELNASHLSNMEAPEEFNSAVLRFLGRSQP